MVGILQGAAGLLARIPLEHALRIGRGLGWFYGTVIRYHRRDAFAALRQSEIRSIVRAMYRHLGMNVMELCRLVAGRADYPGPLVSYDGVENLRAARAQGKGVLALSAHMGNWELICAAAPPEARPLTIIAKNFRNRTFTEFWGRARARFGLSVLPPHGSYRDCLRTLRRNEVIGFMLDQNMIRTEGVFVDFFDRPACTTPGLAYLSAQAQAPVVPVFMIREGEQKHRCVFEAPVEPPPDRRPETIQDYTQRYTRIIENMIRRHPDQWVWIHRRWRTVPSDSQKMPKALVTQ